MSAIQDKDTTEKELKILNTFEIAIFVKDDLYFNFPDGLQAFELLKEKLPGIKIQKIEKNFRTIYDNRIDDEFKCNLPFEEVQELKIEHLFQKSFSIVIDAYEDGAEKGFLSKYLNYTPKIIYKNPNTVCKFFVKFDMKQFIIDNLTNMKYEKDNMVVNVKKKRKKRISVILFEKLF